ncbi:MAG TPA: 3-methyladenine DNA glycosylase, partial [Tessaracoccus flavescens]|nr:3-methyladenine DNA glycosylase [Tessaracoccus flavescens]
MTRLERAAWAPIAEAHRAEVEEELADVVRRRDRGEKHPIDDFLFHYYNLRPSHLAQWHPGVGITLLDAPEYESRPLYRLANAEAEVDLELFLQKRGGTLQTAHRLLAAAAAATPRFGCFGMHEWAMVYRLQPGETRHPYLKLRFPPDELAAIVEEVGCRCSHFDAFRFFTEPAKPLNLLVPTREGQAELDQPGCLHVNMDLYKW